MSRLNKDIPNDWTAIQFDKVFDFLPSLTLSRNDLTSDESFEGIYNIHYGDIHSTYKFVKLDFDKEKSIPKITKKGIDETRLTLLNTGDIVIADASEDYEGVAACIELSNVLDRKVTAGLHTFAARDKKGSTSDGFRGYLLKHPWVSNELKKLATGSKVYGISKTNIAKLEVVLPPIPEQQKIATILSKWDELIEAQSKLIEAKQKQKTSLMQKLLTGKVRFPGFEDEWETYKIKDLFNLTAGKDLLVNHYSETWTKTHKFPLYSNSLTNNGLYGYYNFFQLNENKITVTARGTIGIAKARKKPFNAMGRLLILDPKIELNIDYCAEFINEQINVFIESTGVPQLTAPAFGNYKILIPRVKEQEKIANTLIRFDEEIQGLKDELEAIKLQKKGLMQQLLTGKIRVKV